LGFLRLGFLCLVLFHSEKVCGAIFSHESATCIMAGGNFVPLI
jgi:hypothetical protein